MSLIQKYIPANIEVSYSNARREEMKINNETDCVLVHTIVKQIIQKYSSEKIKTSIPINKNRTIDIYFDFKVKSESDLIKIEDEIKENLKQSLEYVKSFILTTDD